MSTWIPCETVEPGIWLERKIQFGGMNIPNHLLNKSIDGNTTWCVKTNGVPVFREKSYWGQTNHLDGVGNKVNVCLMSSIQCERSFHRLVIECSEQFADKAQSYIEPGLQINGEDRKLMSASMLFKLFSMAWS